MKLGAITVGQSPRTDVTFDIMDLFGGTAELLEAGALDGLTREEIDGLAPKQGDYVLVSRMQDGSSVTFAERSVLPRLQACIDKLEARGVSLIMFFCTGSFPDVFSSHVPLVFPNSLLRGVVPALAGPSGIIDVVPSCSQTEQAREKWRGAVDKVDVASASPYGPWDDLKRAARTVKDMEGDLIVLDCIGYTRRMKRLFSETTGKPVVLSRTLLARTVSEMTCI